MIKNKIKISVVGGSGFVGTNLCQSFFDEKIDFQIIDIKKSIRFPNHFVYADVRILDELRKSISGDVLVNLAAVHRDDNTHSEYNDTNVKGTENIIKVCEEKRIKKIIFTSSVAVYGFALPNTGENGQIKPFNDYGRTKFTAETKYQAWQKKDASRSLIIIRPTVLFGEGNRGNVYNLFRQIAKKRFLMVGAGLNKKSLAYVGNFAIFLNKCVFSKSHSLTFNYVDHPNMTMNELIEFVKINLNQKKKIGFRMPYIIAVLIGLCADVVSKVTGKKFKISSVRVKKFCSSTSFSSKHKTLKGFKAPFTLEEGIKITLINEFISPKNEQEVFDTE